jgi:GT2 family glycosyltransferase
MIKKPIIYTIIVTYNGANWINKCIESILSNELSTQIVLIDNNSSDDTVAFVYNNFPSVIVIENKLNLGFGKANNIGISYALRNNADFVFLLNQDAYINKTTLKDLVALSVQNPNYGIISPIQYNYQGDGVEEYFKNFIRNNAALDLFTDVVLNKEIGKLYEVPFIQAAVWLLPAKTIYEVGGFDPIFIHYGEDNNYCQRIRYHNYLIGIAPHISAFHFGTKVDKIEEIKFSEKYFKNLDKKLKVKYADINLDINEYVIDSLKLKIIKLIIKNIVKFNFKNVRGYFKEYILLSSIFKTIFNSRKLNTIKSSHYFANILDKI